jgi:peptidoglycan/LPS O-acetylase OafA/YrhL
MDCLGRRALRPDEHALEDAMTYIPSLDGVRAIAVAIVLLAHAGVPYVRSGGAGVDVFFALSGFLITSILLAELDLHHSIRLLHFYVRRFLRLLPCLWLTVAAVLCVSAFAGRLDEVKPEAVCAVTYSMNWFRACCGMGGGPLDHTWTLAIEEQYYLIWPLIVGIACRNPQRRIAQGCCLLGAAAALIVYRCSMVDYYSINRIHYGLDTHGDPLLIGSALACFVSAWRGKRLTPLASRVVGYFLAPASMVGIGLIVVTWKWGEGPPALTFGYPLVALFTVVILLDCTLGEHSLLKPVLELGALVWAGRISYGIYLWHLPIFHLLRSHGLDGWRRLTVVGIGLTLVVSAVSYYGVERYCLRLKALFTHADSVGMRKDSAETDRVLDEREVQGMSRTQ